MMALVNVVQAAEKLAVAVAEQCRVEMQEHDLDGRPRLPVPVQITAGTSSRKLVDILAGQPPGRRLVVVGEAGSGKTVLALDLVRGLLERRQPKDPVPVLLPVGSWLPRAASLHDWMIEYLGVDLAAAIRVLARHRRLLLVLDGLGEGTTSSAEDVRLGLHRDLAEQDGFVMTCRPSAYREFVAAGALPAPRMVVRVEPLRPEAVADWLSTQDTMRWAPVVEELVVHPGGAVAQALSTPSMVRLACRVYARTGNPAELVVQGNTLEAVEAYLLDRLLPEFYPDEESQRRLTSLAVGLYRLDTRDLAWWRLHEAVPEPVRGLCQHAAVTLLFAAAFGLLTWEPTLWWFGLGFGLGLGVPGWSGRGLAQASAGLAMLAAIGVVSGLGLLIAGVALVVVLAMVVRLMRRIWVGTAILGALAAEVFGGVKEGAIGAANRGPLLWGMVFGLFLGFLISMLFAGSDDRPTEVVSRLPKRVRFRLRDTVKSFGLRVVGGSVLGLFLPSMIFLSVGPPGWISVACAASGFGLAVGVIVWLNASSSIWLEDADRLLHRDRVAAMSAGVVTGTLIGLGVWLAGLIALRSPQSHELPAALHHPAQIGLAAGLASGAAVAATHACGGLEIARAWFALTRRLPWRTLDLFAEMHSRGALRRSGGVYRFRFDRQQDWLILAHLRRAVIDAEEARRPDHHRVVARLDDLAVALRALGPANEAVPVQERALGLVERERGPYHRDLLARLDELAGTLGGLGRTDEAVPVQQRALGLVERERGPYHRDLVARLDELAGTLRSLGRADEAAAAQLRAHQLALTVADRHLVRDHPDLVTHLDNLATTLQTVGRAGDGLPLQQRALAIREKASGRDHPDLVARLDDMTATLHAMGRPWEALPLQQRALAITEKAYGSGSPDVAARIDNLAATLQAAGRAGDALPLQHRALVRTEHARGGDHPDVADRLQNLATTLRSLGRAGEALPLQQRALAITEHALGRDHITVAARLDELAATLQALGRPWEAVPLLQRALAITEQARGHDDRDVARRLDHLASALITLGRTREALPYLEWTKDILERSLGTQHPDVAVPLGGLAAAMWALGRLEEALPLLQRALAISERTLGPDHPSTATVRSNLGRLTTAIAEGSPPRQVSN